MFTCYCILPMTFAALEFFAPLHSDFGVLKSKLWRLAVKGSDSVEEGLRANLAHRHDPSRRPVLQGGIWVEADIGGDDVLTEELRKLMRLGCTLRRDRFGPCKMFQVRLKEIFVMSPIALDNFGTEGLVAEDLICFEDGFAEGYVMDDLLQPGGDGVDT